MQKWKKATVARLALLALLVAATVFVVCRRRAVPYQRDEGMVFGTIYHITYQSGSDLHGEIMDELRKVDGSLSPFNDRSVISMVNRNEDVEVDSMFERVFRLAMDISRETDGAFDITVAPLVNLWGFGFSHDTQPSAEAIDSIMAIVGYHKVSLAGGRVSKDDPRVTLDCSAIAKGYGTDVVARFLDSRGIGNYMVEIGGEIVSRGLSPRNAPWKIGVIQPDDDSLSVNSEVGAVIAASEIAMATSGNYRNFYYRDGKKYAHTIDPKTGYPVQHNILSATVIAPDCATADAYATAFMVLGLDASREILLGHPELEAYLIYSDGNGGNAVWHSPSLKDRIQ